MAEDGARVILCDASEVAPTRYVESESKRVYEVDHATLEATLYEPPPPEEAPEADEDDAPPNDDDDAEAAAPSREAPPAEAPEAPEAHPLEPARAALAAAIGAYVAGHYGGRGSRDKHHAVYALDGALAVAIRGDKVNLRNFYAGGWASTWTAAVDGSGSSGVVILRRIVVHCRTKRARCIQPALAAAPRTSQPGSALSAARSGATPLSRPGTVATSSGRASAWSAPSRWHAMWLW